MSTPYEVRHDRFAGERDALGRRWNRVANLRLLAFLAAAVALGFGIWNRAPVLIVAGIALLVLFGLLARHHADLGRRRRRAATLVEINREGIARFARDWNALPLRHVARAAADHPFAADLDLFGRASVNHLLDSATTPMGAASVARWLTDPASPETIRARQAAVIDLAPRLDLRQELELLGRLRERGAPDPEPFFAWAEGKRWLADRPLLRGLSWLLPGLFWGLAALQIAAVTVLPFWLLPLAAMILVSQTAGRQAHAVLSHVYGQEGALVAYADQLQLLAGAGFAADELERLRATLTTTGQPAHRHLSRLHRLAGLVIPASSLAYGIVQAITLWDLHLVAAMERWQVVAGGRARSWLTTVGEIEALAALAILAHDEPSWAFPAVDNSTSTLQASALAHPLLPASTRIGNDVEVGPPGSFLLVTGSNMSGKSTLLRAIGANVVLAQAGAPVCAAACSLPPLTICTSMHVEDSLERGVSYFMAELQRLKGVVDAARDAAGGERRLLFLLDEILQGTNTAERQIAARRIARHLVAAGAIGAISTHDLQLAEAPEIATIAHPIHFRETVSTDGAGPAMSFDYTARQGIATSTNALRLMEMIGLDLQPSDAPS
jgi:hypothetical protein